MANFDLIIDINSTDKWLTTLEKDLDSKIIPAIRQGLALLLRELKSLTPEDTQEMLNSYKVIDVWKQGNNYVGEIGNTADHSIFVEFGSGVPFNYHKPKGSVFYTGIGNRTFERALVNTQDKILQLIVDAIG